MISCTHAMPRRAKQSKKTTTANSNRRTPFCPSWYFLNVISALPVIWFRYLSTPYFLCVSLLFSFTQSKVFRSFVCLRKCIAVQKALAFGSNKNIGNKQDTAKKVVRTNCWHNEIIDISNAKQLIRLSNNRTEPNWTQKKRENNLRLEKVWLYSNFFFERNYPKITVN